MTQPNTIYIRPKMWSKTIWFIADTPKSPSTTFFQIDNHWGRTNSAASFESVEEAEKKLSELNILKYHVADNMGRILRTVDNSTCGPDRCICDIQTLVSAGCPYMRSQRMSPS